MTAMTCRGLLAHPACERLEGRRLLAGLPPMGLEAPRNYVTGAIPYQALPMDLDGDGDLDVAVPHGDLISGAQLQLFENTGGELRLKATLPLPTFNHLAAGDFNNDGRLDLAQVRPVQTVKGELLSLVQNGPFSFARRTVSLPFPASRVSAGELDGANGADLVIGDDLSGPRIYTYFSDGAGSFAPGAEYNAELRDRDTNADGYIDRNEPVDMRDCLIVDVNGDGRQDVVVSNVAERSQSMGSSGYWALHDLVNIVVLFNQGAGVLAPFQVVCDPGTTKAVLNLGGYLAAGDMDGDGDRDLVTTATFALHTDLYEVALLRNNGNGTFAAPQQFVAGGGMDALGPVKLADVDGDQDLDVAVPLYGPLAGDHNDNPTDHWSLLRNAGTGALAPPEVYPAGAGIIEVQFADIDGSLGPDVLSVSGDDARVAVHYNRGGIFPTPIVISVDDPDANVTGTSVTDIASGDFNGDGRPDLAVTANHQSLVGEGSDSLILLHGIVGGMGTTPTFIDVRSVPMRILADQMAGSAATDIAIAYMGDSLEQSSDGASLSLGVQGGAMGPTHFGSLTGMPTDLTALDLDGNGTRDLAAIRIRKEGVTAGIGVWSVANDGTLAWLGDLILGSDDVLAGDTRMPGVLTSADMNGDGIMDFVAVTQNIFGTYNRIVSVILSDGELGFWMAGEFLTAARDVTDIIATDVTGDGLPDVVLTTQASIVDVENDGSLEVLPNLGGGILGVGISYNVGTSPVRVAAAEMNGQAGVDLIIANDGSNEVTVLYNNGQGVFPVQERYVAAGGTDGLAAGDFDGDGDTDVAVVHDDYYTIPGKKGHYARVSILTGRRLQAANRPPTIGQLSVDPIVQGADFAVRVGQVVDPDGGTVQKVTVYHDTNANGTFEDGTDVALGNAVTLDPANWRWTGPAATLPLGQNRFFARAFDGVDWSNPVSAIANVTTLVMTGTAQDNTYGIRFDNQGGQVQMFVDTPFSANPTYVVRQDLLRELRIAGGTGADRLVIDASNGQPLGTASLTLDSGALGLDLKGAAELAVSGLHIAPGALLDLAGRDLVVSGDQDLVYDRLVGYIKEGLTGNTGLKSSVANPSAYAGPAIGRRGVNGVKVRYGYNGDANLDGLITADDYFLIDSGYITQAKGYGNGDFNYDGLINADDYFLIDSAYTAQNGPLSAIGPETAWATDAVAMQWPVRKVDSEGILAQVFASEPVLW